MADPVAEFLERERHELAGLGDEEPFEHVAAVPNGGVDDFGLVGDPMPEQFSGGASNHLVNGFSDTTNTSNSTLPSVTAPTVPRIEPEKIRRWREEQKVRLEKKDAEEEKEKSKLKDQAKKELEEWYKNRTDQMEKTKKNNRIAEQEFVKERDADQPGQEWERITRLCEFNPKAAKNAKDVTRFRSILLQLKQNPVVKS